MRPCPRLSASRPNIHLDGLAVEDRAVECRDGGSGLGLGLVASDTGALAALPAEALDPLRVSGLLHVGLELLVGDALRETSDPDLLLILELPVPLADAALLPHGLPCRRPALAAAPSPM